MVNTPPTEPNKLPKVPTQGLRPTDRFYWVQPQPRIVQHEKRRYALRLERVFWQQLESLAERKAKRLGRLVAELAEGYQGANLSSYIRGFCMVEAEREITHYRLGAGAFDLLDVLRSSPAPALLLDSNRSVLEVNQALFDWMGSDVIGDIKSIRQRKFDTIFIPRVTRPLDRTIELMRTGQLKRTQFQATFMADTPRARTVLVTLTGLPVGNLFYCLAWLTITRSA